MNLTAMFYLSVLFVVLALAIVFYGIMKGPKKRK